MFLMQSTVKGKDSFPMSIQIDTYATVPYRDDHIFLILKDADADYRSPVWLSVFNGIAH